MAVCMGQGFCVFGLFVLGSVIGFKGLSLIKWDWGFGVIGVWFWALEIWVNKFWVSFFNGFGNRLK